LLFCKRVGILCVQEAALEWEKTFASMRDRGFFSKRDDKLVLLFDYQVGFYQGFGKGAKHMCLFYDACLFQFEKKSDKVVELTNAKEEKSRYVISLFKAVTLNKSDPDVSLSVFNVHLKSASPATALEHLRQVLDLAKGEKNVIVCGDLNMSPSKYASIVGGFRLVHAAEKGGDGFDLKDNILFQLESFKQAELTTDWKSCVVTEVQLPQSDHAPVYASFKLADSISCRNVGCAAIGGSNCQECEARICPNHSEMCSCGEMNFCVTCREHLAFDKCSVCCKIVHGSITGSRDDDEYDTKRNDHRVDTASPALLADPQFIMSLCFPYHFPKSKKVLCKACILDLGTGFPPPEK
jgi:hypothetical protein